jgi:hypothetical protein
MRPLMTEQDATLERVARRILLALDAALETPTLDVVANLAAQLEAELEGLFVEDIDLFRLAELPFACELGYPSAVVRPLEAASIGRALRNRANQIRLAMEQCAAFSKVACTFQVKRGDLVRDTLAVSPGADLLILYRGGGRLQQSPAKAGAQGVGKRASPVLAVVDDSAAGQRGVLDVASRLARACDERLVIVPAQLAGSGLDQVKTRLAQWLSNHDLVCTVESTAVADAAHLLATHRKWNGGWLVLSRDSPLLDDARLRQLLVDLARPIVLVGNQASSPGPEPPSTQPAAR